MNGQNWAGYTIVNNKMWRGPIFPLVDLILLITLGLSVQVYMHYVTPYIGSTKMQ